MAQHPDHDRIAKKAHELWEAEGRPHGRDQDHWDQAREIVAVEDSQGSTLKRRTAGAKRPVEEPGPALRNLADMPNLTDQGENLLTSTDREPPLTATPSGRKGRMPKAEVPTSDQPGIAGKGRKASAKTDKTPARRGSSKSAASAAEASEPKSESAPAAATAANDAEKVEFAPRRGGRRRKAE